MRSGRMEALLKSHYGDPSRVEAQNTPSWGESLSLRHRRHEVGNFAGPDGVEPELTGEIELQWGQDILFTVVVRTSILKQGVESLILTSWHVPATGVPDGKPLAGEHWNKVITPKETHKVHYDGAKPLIPDTLAKVLVEQGIIID
ncbi:hypothetical protein HETIRDRAFT_424731 [Heterobasidion irregulare TC 32-1]|uniref:Uncharacterized protein n=1 Tax=Heterobasidion irregulare (strain TC 32-1) TaxID=747525 RepID=W4KJF6_HETIT|nr:uncharacterized protein HETIRDRAFT_424731 [Heterobasidion irregulare TC 32-1]ETW85450.1 hypothetical protein HETIRDRAFT_424731 [Heterobasidion irregulare TC 32-1]